VLDDWKVIGISCSSWGLPEDEAQLTFSNERNELFEFTLYKTENRELELKNLHLMFDLNRVADYQKFMSTLPDFKKKAAMELKKWNMQLFEICELMPEGKWVKNSNTFLDLNFALTAYFVELLGKHGGLQSVRKMSEWLGIDEATAKERIRIVRERGFLSSPGKGVRGASQITAKARKLLEKEGVIDAKKSK
jgi:hypothetical protein